MQSWNMLLLYSKTGGWLNYREVPMPMGRLWYDVWPNESNRNVYSFSLRNGNFFLFNSLSFFSLPVLLFILTLKWSIKFNPLVCSIKQEFEGTIFCVNFFMFYMEIFIKQFFSVLAHLIRVPKWPILIKICLLVFIRVFVVKVSPFPKPTG